MNKKLGLFLLGIQIIPGLLYCSQEERLIKEENAVSTAYTYVTTMGGRYPMETKITFSSGNPPATQYKKEHRLGTQMALVTMLPEQGKEEFEQMAKEYLEQQSGGEV